MVNHECLRLSARRVMMINNTSQISFRKAAKTHNINTDKRNKKNLIILTLKSIYKIYHINSEKT